VKLSSFNGQVESSVECDGLVHDSKIPVDVLELMTQRSDLAR